MSRTASKPEKQTAPQAVRVGVREFRAQLKRFQDGDQAVLIGSPWTCRGIFLPVHRKHSWGDTNERDRATVIRALLEAALTEANIE